MLSKMSSDLKKIILAGIGAAATSVEKSEEMVKNLVSKGELTIEQGKVMNQELRHKFHEAEKHAKAVHVEKMSKEERAELKRQLEEIEAKEQAVEEANQHDEPKSGE